MRSFNMRAPIHITMHEYFRRHFDFSILLECRELLEADKVFIQIKCMYTFAVDMKDLTH